jgi:hypothetical protein
VNDELGEVADDSAWDCAQHRVDTELKSLQDTPAWYGNWAPADLRGDGVANVGIFIRGRYGSGAIVVPDHLTTLSSSREYCSSIAIRKISTGAIPYVPDAISRTNGFRRYSSWCRR